MKLAIARAYKYHMVLALHVTHSQRVKAEGLFKYTVKVRKALPHPAAAAEHIIFMPMST